MSGNPFSTSFGRGSFGRLPKVSFRTPPSALQGGGPALGSHVAGGTGFGPLGVRGRLHGRVKGLVGRVACDSGMALPESANLQPNPIQSSRESSWFCRILYSMWGWVNICHGQRLKAPYQRKTTSWKVGSHPSATTCFVLLFPYALPTICCQVCAMSCPYNHVPCASTGSSSVTQCPHSPCQTAFQDSARYSNKITRDQFAILMLYFMRTS